jgi:hypothetical protein
MSSQKWPCANCGASQEFGLDGCDKHTPMSFHLDRYCGSDRVEIAIECSCSSPMYRSNRDGRFRCTNCRKSVAVDYIRKLVDTWKEKLAIFAQELEWNDG